MYAGTAAFAEAIRNRRAQHALALFPSFCLEDEDISADGGISFCEYLNTDEDLTMGKAMQSEISLSLVNRDGHLSELDFTEAFTFYLGTETTDERVSHTVPSGNDLAIIMDADGIAAQVYASTSGQSIVCGTTAYAVSAAPRALLAHDRKLYVGGESGLIAAYELLDDGTLNALALPALNEAMSAKFRRWAQQRRCACLDGSKLRVYSDISYAYTTWREMLAMTWAQAKGRTWGEFPSRMRCVTTEYAPLGVFIGERPEKLRTRLIELNAYDNMVKFEREAEGFFDSLTYPITLRAYFEALCAYCGVVPAAMTRFINGDKTFASAPINTNGLTCRGVLAYLAEAACSYARMNRDGECELAWYADSGYTVYRTDRFALDRAEYEVTPIDRTQVKVTENDIGVLVGSGNNGYTVVDCPFLYGMSDADVRPWAENIHNELVLIEAYSPMTADAECDWRVQCGDIITVEEDDGTLYKTPVFVQTITWNGHASVTYESTGRIRREEMNHQQREQVRTGRAWYEIQKTIEGLVSRVGKVEDFDGRISECESLIKQTSESITTSVTKSEQALSVANSVASSVSGLETRVSTAEHKITSEAIVSTVRSSTSYTNDLSGKVSKTEVISSINQSAESIKISAPKISLEGIITSNGNVKIDEAGNITCNNGKFTNGTFTGTLKTGNWTFDSNGSSYGNGGIGVNMTVMSGNFVGGDSSGTRAFYGSSGCDVQYGADYNCTAYMRAGGIKFIVQNNSDMSDWCSAYCRRSDTGQFTFVCGESTDGSWSGNIGASGQRWDYVYTNVLKAYNYPSSSSRSVKQNIVELPDVGDMLDRLVPVSYEYKHHVGDVRYGFIYEDALEVLPEICLDTGDGDPGIRYTDLIAPMIKEIQSLRKRVAKLEVNTA